jgi:hypothetical protein
MMEERRRHVRYPVSVPGRCVQPGRPEVAIQVLNLSAASLLARSPQPFLQLKAARLRVELQEGTVECEAVCVRATTAPPWEGAFLFTEVDPESAERLGSFLERLGGGRHA